MNLGKLEEIKDLRKIWPHEALDFTPWIAQDENITLLADAVGLDITVDETEKPSPLLGILMWIFLPLKQVPTAKLSLKIS